MSKDHVFQFAVFFALLCHCVSGFVPSVTNVSVVCHNFVNVLYWNYSNTAGPLKFSVLIQPYVSDSRTINTSQTYVNISDYSNDASDTYIVDVTAYAGQEKSESASIEFTYSKDYYNENTHKCSLDFPAINMTVHKDEIKTSFWHPYRFYKHESLNEDFSYTVTYDQKTFSEDCSDDEDEDDDLCTAQIHLNQSAAGHCVEMRFEGTIAAIPTSTTRNICLPQLKPEKDYIVLIVALLGGGLVLIFIALGAGWLIRKKWSKHPKVPEVLRSFMTGHSSTALLSQTEPSIVSPTASDGHKPQLNEDSYGSSPIYPDEKDCETTTDLANQEMDESEQPGSDDDFTGFSDQPSDYNSPQFLQELDTEDFAEGYGPRPPVI